MKVYVEVYEGVCGIWRYIRIWTHLFDIVFFRLFGGPLSRHCSFLSYLVLFGCIWGYFDFIWLYLVLFLLYLTLFGLIWSYLVLFGFIWSYLVLFGLIWSYLVLSGLNLPDFALFCFICCLVLFYFALCCFILTLFELIQVPIKPKKGSR